ncbi:hypothetical protein LSUE1_G007403 [Lachnellula suecica]|uniref:Zn(2)-C6 fungal-type domain-containing protein n=1 Tax=Lachnellula suecica TaxID=602035 RepID=A0A8T9CCY2_9HELO|nr:hypothetical protein LSUE1_G007403 [Lachnellula suecica]
MVYQGPSRGCVSCKRRRKKSCMRCLRANRGCGGYEDGALSAFRMYGSQDADSTYVSTARKCSLPVLVALPGTTTPPSDTLPVEATQADSSLYALRAFFYDCCVISTNLNLSRGFLSGLEKMAYGLGMESDLVQACKAISLGSHSKVQQRPKEIQKAELIYQKLLGSLAKAIENPPMAKTAELKLIAMLLGLYQIIMTSETDLGYHEFHAKGIAALMKIGNFPLNLLGSIRCSRIPHSSKTLRVPGIFCTPALVGEGESLDDLLLNLNMLWTESEGLFDLKDISSLRIESITLDRRFAKWQDSRVAEFKPTAIGKVNQSQHEADVAAGYWSGNVDTYFDLYVAGVWNIFRSARLLLILLIMNLSDTIGEHENGTTLNNTAESIAEEIFASVPYHLADNLQVFLSDLATSKHVIDPGRTLGGLLLMHPLYVVSKMPFLPESMRIYAQKCLLWTGTYMGIGQATLLAKVGIADSLDYLSTCR